jgi:hypothetical protein
MKGLRKLGIAVPHDVSVVGFDNIILDELVEPALTTVASPLYRMGFTGVQNRIAVSLGARPSNTVGAPGPPVVRRSTAQCRRTRIPSARGTTSGSGSVATAASPDHGSQVHPIGRSRRAHSNETRLDSSFDSTLGSSTSIMKSPS